jgi:hypothetical protein
VYVNNTVVVRNWNRVSYNGGRGGLDAHATAAEMAAQRERHIAPTPVQVRHQQYAVQNRAAFSRVNQGRPQAAAVARPYSAPNRAPQSHAQMARPAMQEHRVAPQMRPAAQEHRAAPQMHAAPQAHAAPAARPAAPARGGERDKRDGR